MQIKRIVVGHLFENCYLVSEGENVLLIDPGEEALKIEQFLEGKTLQAILITHHHFDHVGALPYFQEKYTVPVYDAHNLEEKEYTIANMSFRVIETKGHSEDSISYYFFKENSMFVGDFLFQGTIGRTDFETGDPKKMQESLQKIKTYPDEITIYPGHGNATTLLEEKRNNPYLKNF